MQNINDDIGIPSHMQTKFPQTTLIVIKGFRGGNFQVSGETRPISYVGKLSYSSGLHDLHSSYSYL